jgi:hypothetical protein
MNYEKKINELQLNLSKLERDNGFKEEEIKSMQKCALEAIQ